MKHILISEHCNINLMHFLKSHQPPRSKSTIADLTEDDIDLVSKKVLGEAKEETKEVDPKRQEAIASLFHVRDRDKVGHSYEPS